MTTPSPDTHSSMDACPPLEDIAAFIDGINLSPEERARITEHLARCESCYEIFSGAVHFQEEEDVSSADGTGGGGVITFPLGPAKTEENSGRTAARPTRRVSRWLPLAASVVLAVGLGYMIWQNYRVLPDVTVAEVTSSLPENLKVAGELYEPDIFRSGPQAVALPSSAAPFLAGVYLVDLRFSEPAGRSRTTEDILDSVASVLEQMLVNPENVAFFRDQSKHPDLEVLTRELPKQESALENELVEDPLFRFGLWAEAARISAKVQSPAFFEQRVNRRFLLAIPRELRAEGDDRYQPVLNDLQTIVPLWDRSPKDYEALARHFESIIDQMERIRKEDEDPELPLTEP